MSVRSQLISVWIQEVWTSSRTRPEGVAEKWFDGRVDALSLLLLDGEEEEDEDEDEDEDKDKGKERGGGEIGGDTVIQRRSSSDMDYADFVNEFMSPNIPVIIEGLVSSWNASLLFNDGGELDLSSLEESFGDSIAPVHVTKIAPGQSSFGGVSRPATTNMTVADYCEWFRQHRETGTGVGDVGENVERSGGGDEGRELLYLKVSKIVGKPEPEQITRRIAHADPGLGTN